MFKRAWLLPLVVSFVLLLAFPQEVNNIELSIQPSFTDSDNDGYNDSDDDFPNHPDAWSDSDGDGYADQPNTNISDDCPNTHGSSRIHMMGCRDIDQDWIPDVLDDDIDGDGFSNNEEAIAGTKIWDAVSQPVVSSIDDNDGDGDVVGDDNGDGQDDDDDDEDAD